MTVTGMATNMVAVAMVADKTSCDSYGTDSHDIENAESGSDNGDIDGHDHNGSGNEGHDCDDIENKGSSSDNMYTDDSDVTVISTPKTILRRMACDNYGRGLFSPDSEASPQAD